MEGGGGKETEGEETGGKETGTKEAGGKVTGAKAPGAQYSQETGRKGDILMGDRAMNDMVPGDTTAGQNATGGIRRKSYSEVVIEWVRRRASVCGGFDSHEDWQSAKPGGRLGGLLSRGNNRGYHREREKKLWVRAR